MTSVPPHGISTPMLLGGPHARAATPVLAALGFAVTPVSDEYGVASAIKMCRSVIVKGMEAIVIESFLTARRYGVEREVLASLAETFPGINWEEQGSWFWKRVVQHGRRRAEEMREAAVTVREAGVASTMAVAIADTQAAVAALAAGGAFNSAGSDARWRDLADCVPRGDVAEASAGRVA
jgi:3-hydroxyisobutyrate dehydrogenase-like beta-hydroxyacid dehydrogenase